MCTWQNSKNSDDFDWIRAAGETMTAGAGPTNDHTLGSPHGKISFVCTLYVLSWIYFALYYCSTAALNVL